ncbi:MAG TPA: fasciclin domain-containing protein [Pyrinomonadaceae bacterium]|nr:fasciclin domain-containing protein [Pyrinomonadaceae bacterium]
MKLNKLVGKKIVALGAMLSLIAIVMSTPVNARVASNETNDIVDTAVAAGQFKTLAAALEAAELIDALKGNGPFTVFAPTDEAFAKLPAGTVESLLKPENKEKLKAVLLYHVVPGSVTADKVTKLNGRSVKTLQGNSIKVKTSHGVQVDNAKVTKTDIKASNGVIHVIDTVLMPSM